MDKVHVELLRGYLDKARAKLRVARDLVERGEWDDAQAAILCEGERADTHRVINIRQRRHDITASGSEN